MVKPLCEYCKKNESVYAVFIKKPIEYSDAASFVYDLANNNGDIESTQFKTIEEFVICEDCYRNDISLKDFNKEEIDRKKPMISIQIDMSKPYGRGTIPVIITNIKGES
jgi:hypothetical protein